MIIKMSILIVDTCTRSKVITYSLDSTKGVHGAMYVEQKIEYHSDHRNDYRNSLFFVVKILSYRENVRNFFTRILFYNEKFSDEYLGQVRT